MQALGTLIGVVTAVTMAGIQLWGSGLVLLLNGEVAETSLGKAFLGVAIIVGVGLMLAITASTIYEIAYETDYSGSFFCDVIGA